MAGQSSSLFSAFRGVPGQSKNPFIEAAKKVAKKHDVTHGQAVIRWARHQGVGFLTKFNSKYADEDLQCSDFDLGDNDNELLESAPTWPCELTVTLVAQNLAGCLP